MVFWFVALGLYVVLTLLQLLILSGVRATALSALEDANADADALAVVANARSIAAVADALR